MTPFTQRVGALAARLAPEPLRSQLASDGLATMAEAMADARRRGRADAAVSAIAEIASLCLAAVRARAGRFPAVSSGPPPRGRHGQPRFRGETMIARLRHDLRFAARSLAAAPGYTLLVMVTLAVGIGVNTTVFSVLDSILFRPVPYADGDRLASMWAQLKQGNRTMAIAGQFNPALIVEWRRQADLFDRVEAHERRSFVFEADTGAEMVSGATVSIGLFPMLGVRPELGRWFADGDGRDGSERRAIVSGAFWRQQLDRDPQVVGRQIVLDGQRHEIVGVMPATFRYPDERHQVWTPLDVTNPPAAYATGRAGLETTVRLAPGMSFERADGQAKARGAEVHRVSGGDGTTTAMLIALGRFYDERTRRSLLVLGGAVGFLLLIVCANVANLTLSRSLARRRDLAVRTALGATRSDLTRESLAEYLLLGLIGAAGGLGVAQLALAVVRSVLPETITRTSLNVVDLDVRTLGFLTAATLLTAVFCGLPAAWLSSRAAVADALRNDSRTSSGSARANRVRAGLVVVEVALTIILLIGAALMTRTLLRLQAIDTGIDPDGLLALELALPAPGFSSEAVRETFVRDLVSQLRRLDGVTAAAAGSMPLKETRVAFGDLELGDRPGEPIPQQLVTVADVWPGFLAAAGIRLVAGRDFRDDETGNVAIASERFVRKHWPSANAVGQRFKFGKAGWRTIVGVAADVRPMTDDSGRSGSGFYYPYNQVSDTASATRPISTIAAHQTIVVRANAPGEVAAALGRTVHAVDSRVVVGRTTMVADEMADAIARPRIVFVMLSVFAGVGLLLAGAGVYGVLSHLVSQRRREIGIRLALGATTREIGRLIMRRGLILSVVGLAIGLAASFWLVGLMRTLLYEVEPTDPISVVLVSVVLLTAAAAAAWRPARRAMRFDPVVLLRE